MAARLDSNWTYRLILSGRYLARQRVERPGGAGRAVEYFKNRQQPGNAKNVPQPGIQIDSDLPV
jgi:hypothetical protein